eukprot:TRINITY_DN2913_c0_g1_i4.p1 TRINITY_DN2913_c0_g1~~TRINITY_DN2913_c0_g1_i4.p1  ORF type:complete len:470 (-),score=51.03 TRINITY_DN2913_c0_g1_i4:48-1457(-)
MVFDKTFFLLLISSFFFNFTLTQQGLLHELYSGSVLDEPQDKTILANLSSYASPFKYLNDSTSGFLRWSGFLTLPSNGNYSFRIVNFGFTRVWLHDRYIFNKWHIFDNEADNDTDAIWLLANVSYFIDIQFGFFQYDNNSFMLRWLSEVLGYTEINPEFLSPSNISAGTRPPGTDDRFGLVLESSGKEYWVSGLSFVAHTDFLNLTFRGYILPPINGSYQLEIKLDDIVEIWIGDYYINITGTTQTAQSYFGPYNLTLEHKFYNLSASYGNLGGLGELSVFWKYGSKSLELIGPEYFVTSEPIASVEPTIGTTDYFNPTDSFPPTDANTIVLDILVLSQSSTFLLNEDQSVIVRGCPVILSGTLNVTFSALGERQILYYNDSCRQGKFSELNVVGFVTEPCKKLTVRERYIASGMSITLGLESLCVRFPTGAIIGIVVGGVLLILVVFLIIVFSSDRVHKHLFPYRFRE